MSFVASLPSRAARQADVRASSSGARAFAANASAAGIIASSTVLSPGFTRQIRPIRSTAAFAAAASPGTSASAAPAKASAGAWY